MQYMLAIYEDEKLAQAGRRTEAAEAYDAALALGPGPAETLYLQTVRAAL